MIKKYIVLIAIITLTVYGNQENKISSQNVLAMNDKVTYEVWNPPMGKKESGESCKDGNCIGSICGLKKDGKIYKAFTSVRDKLKKKCKL